MTAVLLILSLVIGSLSLAVGYALAGNIFATGALLGFALLWLLARWRKWRWFASLNLGMAVFAALTGVWLHTIPLGWLYAGVCGALLAWDLEAFSRRLALAAQQDDRRRVERNHWLHLAQLIVLAVLLAVTIPLVNLEISFSLAFWLVVLLAIGLTRTVLWLRRQVD